MIRDDTIEATKSTSGKAIRLTFEQWFHIVESHDYMAGNISNILETVNSPYCIVKGTKDELIALKHYFKTKLGEKNCIVVYRENGDGFIITAFFTSRPESIKKRGVLWQK